ncbi:MAG: hypothetical protein AAF620_12355 [Bacteroidota bacterium]
MPNAFLSSPTPNTDIQANITTETTSEPGREKVKLLVIGSSFAVERVIHELYRVGFAEVREWSQPLPTGTYGEVLRILTRYVMTD